MDNSVSVSYLNNIGGQKKKFNTLTKMIWLWCIDCNTILSSALIAGSENLTADRLSRDRNIDNEWKLNIVVICPLWATQPWFPLFLGMIVEDSYNLPQTSKLLYLPQDPDRHHLLRKMRLGAFRLSGKPWRIQAYMDKQQILSLIPGGHLQQNSIGVISKTGCSFQIQDKLIHSTHL